MFQTFTGNSRRPRQVNLSGRTSNPFAAVQSSSSSGSGSGSGAIAHAQHERKARQQERDRLQASKKLQRTWRGYRSRKELRNQHSESLRASERRLDELGPEKRGFEDVWQHLRLCVKAVRPDARDVDDAVRLVTAGEWLCERQEELLAACRLANGEGATMAPLRSLLRLSLRLLNSMLFYPAPTESQTAGDCPVDLQGRVEGAIAMLAAILWTMSLVPIKGLFDLRFSHKDILARDPSRGRTSIPVIEQYYRILGRASQLKYFPDSGDFAQVAKSALTKTAFYRIIAEQVTGDKGDTLTFTQGVLAAPGGLLEKRETAYVTLVEGLLTQPELSTKLLSDLRELLDMEAFLINARHVLEGKGSQDKNNSTEHQTLLANTIYLCNTDPSRAKSSSQASGSLKVDSISINLSFLAILTRALQDYDSVDDLDQYTQEQLRRLVRPETISALFNRTDWISTDKANEQDARILADYLLTIIRLLPSQADEVRMWIYLSNSKENQNGITPGQSAVRLFWTAISRSWGFKHCCSGPREAAEVLPESGILRSSVGRETRRTSDWNMILLFLELYSFALRIQDDEQLVAGLNAGVNGSQAGTSTLSLEEIKQVVTFLKNVSYAIYTERSVSIDDASSSSQRPESTRGYEPPRGIADTTHRVSMPQLKGTATALLRMIYERDSRRNFLPPGHFIMEQFESTTFITDVLREQELRAHLEEEAEDSDEDTEMPDWGQHYSADREVMISRHTQQVQRHHRMAEMHKRQARKQALQRAAPRVEVLENIPFLVPFETRIQLFRQQVELDMYYRRGGDIDPDHWRMGLAARNPMEAQRELGAHSAELRRDHVFEDAFKAFYTLGEGLKEPIKISFIGEEGIDGGGVTKEFLTSIIDEVFSIDSTHNLFAENDQHELYPYPSALDEINVFYRNVKASGARVEEESIRQAKREKLQFYEFVGRVVGKCLYEGILVHIPLARFFIAKWALTGGDGASRNETTFRPSINDLWDYDQAIYRSMLQIKNYPGDVQEMGFDFTVTDDVGGGERLERELKPGGSNVPVNNANRLIYIAQITKHYLVDRQGPQTRAFLDGLSSIIRPTWLRMFNEAEIRTLLGGEAKPIDVEDLRHNTVYGGVYVIGNDGKEHPTIKMFWDLMHEMQDSDRRKLLQYATSTPNAPLMGFSHLNPRFSIRDSMSDQGRLPTSSTCANLLKLPIYKTKEVLREKVMTAIHSGAGFDLS